MMIEESEVEKALDYLRDNSENAAKTRAERIYLEEYRKSLKASIMTEHLEKAVNAQEREAYADERYKDHLAAMRESIFRDEQHRFLREAASAKIEAWRSQCANERAGRL